MFPDCFNAIDDNHLFLITNLYSYKALINFMVNNI